MNKYRAIFSLLIIIMLTISSNGGCQSEGEEPPDAPTLLTPAFGGTINENTPVFDWEDFEGATEYNFRLRYGAHWRIDTIVDESEYIRSVTQGNDNQYWPLLEGNNFWQVRALDAAGEWSDWSDLWPFTVRTVKWVFVGNGNVSEPAVGDDQTVYVSGGLTGEAGYLYALNTLGLVEWSYTLCDTGFIFNDCPPAIGTDGTIFVTFSADSDYVYAFNPNGSLVWQIALPSAPSSRGCLAIAQFGTIYAANSGYLHAISTSGDILWTWDNPGPGFIWGIGIATDGTIYVGARDRVCAINPDGSDQWTYLSGGADFTSPALGIGTGGSIYVSDISGNQVVALSASGSFLWSLGIGGGQRSDVVIGTGGMIYASGNKLYAISSSGHQQWTCDYGSFTASIASDNTILLGGFDPAGHLMNFYGINHDGTLHKAWNLCSGGSGTSAIGTDGTIYVRISDRAELYALYGTENLANTSWPMLYHDATRTCRAGGP